MGLRTLTVDVSGSWTRTERSEAGFERLGETWGPFEFRRDMGVQNSERKK